MQPSMHFVAILILVLSFNDLIPGRLGRFHAALDTSVAQPRNSALYNTILIAVLSAAVATVTGRLLPSAAWLAGYKRTIV